MNNEKNYSKHIIVFIISSLVLTLLMNILVMPQLTKPKVEETNYSFFLDKLEEGDIVIGMDTLKANCEVLSVTSEGFGKRTNCDEYRRQARGGKGIINMKVTEKTGKVVGIKVVHAGQEMMLISTEGIVIRINVDEISVISRNTQGVKVMRTDSNDRVAALAIANRKTEADA